MDGNTNTGSGMTCKCQHHHAIAWLAIIIGALFLLEAVGVLTSSFVWIAWPIVLIAGGFMKLGSRNCKCCSNP